MIAWMEHLTLEWESPWSVMSKLAWLNHCEPAGFLTGFYALSVEQAGPRRDFVDPAWMGAAVWQGVEGSEPFIGGRPLTTALAERSLVRLISDSAGICADLRTCPVCVGFGYHGLLHQLAGLERCPVHLAQLQVGCPCCGSPADYAVAPGASAFGCGHCEGAAGWKDDWVPSLPGNFAADEAEAFSTIAAWFSKVAPLPIHVSPMPLLAKGGAGDEPTANGTRAWLAHKMLEATFNPALFGHEPASCALQVYPSASGELLRPTPGAGRTMRIEFVLGVLGALDEAARRFVERFAELHPCLALAHESFRINHRDADPYVIAGKSACCVALGYYVWYRRAVRMLEEIDAASTAWLTGDVQGEVADVGRALVTELHSAIYASWRASSDGICHTGKLGDELDRRARTVNRLLVHWSRPDETGPVTAGHVRPELDYGGLIASIACGVASPSGAARLVPICGDSADGAGTSGDVQ